MSSESLLADPATLTPVEVTPAAPVRRRPRAGLTVPNLIGVLMVLSVVAFCVIYPLLPAYSPYQQELSAQLQPPFQSSAHWLGTDNLGRDVASRLALAGRVTLSIVLGVITMNAILGTLIGITAGYAGGRVDNLLMGLSDVQLALPILLILIALAASRGPSVWLMIIVLACTYWVGYARVARAMTLSLRHRDFVLAPRIQGASTGWVMRRHILPNLIGEMFILASSDIGTIILLTSSFDFLGLGVQPPVPSWGLMISEGQKYLRQHGSLALVPGLAIFLIVAGVNLVSQRFTNESAVPGRRRPIGNTADTTGPATDSALLEISELTVVTRPEAGDPVTIVDRVSLEVGQQEVLCLVGESGSGKSVTMLAALGLLAPGLAVTSGSVRYRGRDLLGLTDGQLRQLRGKDLAMVFQDPMTALNPVKRVGVQIERAIRRHQPVSRLQAREQVAGLLEQVGVPQPKTRAKAYPHQWSGGMRQRAMVALAIANTPSVLVADEPTTALDVTVQAQVMDVLASARARTGAAMVMITHDLGLVAQVADRVAIMYSGRIVEQGHVLDIFEQPAHPYTRGLLGSLLTAENAGGAASAIPGAPPSPAKRPPGCAFAPRCANPARSQLCLTVTPVLQAASASQQVACHHAHLAAPQQELS
jgi:peptide/nickel transport system permease protein